MLMTCREPGCTTIVMGGGRCVFHEPHESRVFLRGRPFMSELPTGVRTGHEERLRLPRATPDMRLSVTPAIRHSSITASRQNFRLV